VALNNLGLGLLFTARDLATQTVRKLDRSINELDKDIDGLAERSEGAFKQMATGLGLLTAGAVGLKGAINLADAAGEFEQGLSAVGAVMGATGAEMDLLEASATRAGIATQFSPTEAAKGLQSLAAAGQTARESTETLVPVLDLAAASLGQLGVAESAEAVVGTLKSYGLEAGNAADVTDRLVKITSISNFQARDFSVGLSKAAAAGSAFNQDLNEVLISMGLMRNANIDASSSATAFREATRRLGSEEKIQKDLLKAGVRVFDKRSGKMRSVIDIIGDMQTATEGMSEAQRNNLIATTLGARGLLLFNAVSKAAFTKTLPDGTKQIVRGAAAIDAMRGKMGEASGAAAEFRSRLLDTFEGQKTLLKGTLQTLAITLGKPFAQIFKPVVQAVTNGLNLFIKAFTALPAPVQKAIGVVFLAVAAFTALAGAITLFRAASSIVGPVMASMRAAILAAIGPMLPFIAIAAAVVAVFFLLKKAYDDNIGGFGDDMRAIWNDDLKPVLSELKDLFIELARVFMKSLRPLFPVLTMLFKHFAKIVKVLLPIIAFITKVFVKVLVIHLKVIAWVLENVLIPVFRFLGEVATNVAAAMTAVFGSVSDFLVNDMAPAWEFIGKVATAIGRDVMFVWEGVLSVLDWIVDKLESVWDMAKDVGGFFSDAGGGVFDFAGDLIGDAANFILPGAGVATNVMDAIPQIQSLAATGGPSSPQSEAVAGEAASGRVAGQRALAQMAGLSGGGGATTVNSRITVELDGEKVGEAVARHQVDDADRRNQASAGGVD